MKPPRRGARTRSLFRLVLLAGLRGVLRDALEVLLGEVQGEDRVVALRFVFERGERVGLAAFLEELAVLADLEGGAGEHGHKQARYP